MRKLRRRLLRWERYAVATGWTSEWAKLVRSRPPAVWHYSGEPGQRAYARRNRIPLGLIRAAAVVDAEQERRFWDETDEVWLGGPEGERALLADVLGCTCPGCMTGGRCIDDEPDSNRCCNAGDAGEHVEDVYVGPRVETLAVDRGLL